MKVIRKRLDAVQTRVPFTRWSNICECVEITFDEGLTWVESPENDPREGVGFRAPPLTGIDAQCDAAARMVDVIRQQVDAALDAATAVGIATAIIGIVTALVPGINLLVNLFVAIAGALVTIGAVAIDEAFTEEVYDGLICIFYDNIDENGQVSSAQIVQIQNDVNAQYPGVVFEVFALLVLGLGSNGFSNAGSLGDATGDCETCCEEDDPFCQTWDFTVDDGGWSPATGYSNAAQYITDTGWASMWTSPNNRLYIERGFNRSLVEFISFDYVGSSPSGSEMFVQFFDGATLVHTTSNTPYASGAATRSYTVSVECDRVVIIMFGQYDTQNLIVSAELSGVGCPGFGANNC